MCNLLSFKEKKLATKNAEKLEKINIFINEDFCPETMKYCKQLCDEVKELHRKGNASYLNYLSVVNKGTKRDNLNKSSQLSKQQVWTKSVKLDLCKSAKWHRNHHLNLFVSIHFSQTIP